MTRLARTVCSAVVVYACMCGVTTLAQPISSTLLLPGVHSLPPKKSVLVFGQKISYYDTGTGPTLVLVHGMASQARMDWGAVIVPLSKTHRVIALDQIGFGESAKPQIDYSIQTFVDFLGEFLRTLKVQHFTLAGESLGGWVSSAYTIQALSPANTGTYAVPRPDKLILEDAAGNIPGKVGRNNPAQVQGSLAEARGISFIMSPKTKLSEEFVRETWVMKMQANDGGTQRSFRANPRVADESVHDKISQITIPTLILWGNDDHVVPMEQGKDYAARIPHAKMTIIPESGHVPSLEQPKAFLAAVKDFLK